MVLTVFTPTYNREKYIPKAYEALCKQTVKEFCWLIVDDGSTDGTEEVVQSLIKENKIKIRYEKQENGGKMRAHNYGVRLCETEFFVCVDSDDYLVENAVESMLTQIERMRDRKKLAGIVAYRGKDATHTMQGEKFPIDKNGIMVETSTLQGLYKNGFFGDTTLVFRTEVLREYPFPEFTGEKFITEAVVYDKIDEQYKLLVVNQIWTICEYRESGLSKSIEKLRRDNPRGWLLHYKQRITGEKQVFLRCRYLGHGINFCILLNKNPFEELPAGKFLIAAAYPVALLLRLMRLRRKYRI